MRYQQTVFPILHSIKKRSGHAHATQFAAKQTQGLRTLAAMSFVVRAMKTKLLNALMETHV